MFAKVIRRFCFPYSRPFTQIVPATTPIVMDSISGKLKGITSAKDYLTWYSCGPTVYDASHIGHGRTYVQIDILQRLMEKRLGYSVFSSLGITNIDDKIINRSKELKISWNDLADRYEKEYFDDMRSLNIQAPKATIRVSDTIPEIIDYINILLDKKIAYETRSGVYFDTQSPLYTYSKLLPSSAETEMQSRIAPQEDKRNMRDFALWKTTNEEGYCWPSPWGKGRPGWHIECSVNCHLLYGDQLDMHAGGIDLKFPHHCNEIAQCEAYSGQEWCNCFIHIGHIYIQGRKMSKSLKNFISIKDLLKSSNSDEFRMFCLLNHYSSRISYDENNYGNAKEKMQVLKDQLLFLDNEIRHPGDPTRASVCRISRDLESFQLFKNSVLQSIVDNFDTPAVMQRIHLQLKQLHDALLVDRDSISSSILKEEYEYTVQLLHDMGFQLPFLESSSGEKDDLVLSTVLDTVCLYRKEMREVCLEGKRTNQNTNDTILKKCDELREKLRNEGVSILDGKQDRLWIKQRPEPKKPKQTMAIVPAMAPELLYQDPSKYSQWDNQGIPTHDANGKELSKKRIKKLSEHYEKHKRIHEAWLKNKKQSD